MELIDVNDSALGYMITLIIYDFLEYLHGLNGNENQTLKYFKSNIKKCPFLFFNNIFRYVSSYIEVY